MLQIDATLVKILPQEHKGENTYQKVWVETTKDMYPQKLELDLTPKLVKVLHEKNVSEGGFYTFCLNLKGREIVKAEGNKLFNIIQAWDILPYVNAEN